MTVLWLPMFLLHALSGLPYTFNHTTHARMSLGYCIRTPHLICISPSSLGSYYSTAVSKQQKAQQESLNNIDGNWLVTQLALIIPSITQLPSRWQNSHDCAFLYQSAPVCVSFALSRYGKTTP